VRPWCPHCGYKENPQWRNSRFVYNADLMRFDEAEQDPELERFCRFLANKKNAFPFYALAEGLVYYRRGTDRMYLYRVPISDFNMPRERKNHKAHVRVKAAIGVSPLNEFM
jgi:hypothetical protein